AHALLHGRLVLRVGVGVEHLRAVGGKPPGPSINPPVQHDQFAHILPARRRHQPEAVLFVVLLDDQERFAVAGAVEQSRPAGRSNGSTRPVCGSSRTVSNVIAPGEPTSLVTSRRFPSGAQIRWSCWAGRSMTAVGLAAPGLQTITL